MTLELQKKVDRAVKLIQSAGKISKEHGQPLEICYSGGKDSDTILELARISGVDYRAIYKNTTIDPPGTIKHAKEKGVEVMQPAMNFRQIIEKKGFPNRWRRFCCSVLKEYKVLDYAVVGVRRDESSARSKRYHEPEVCRVYNKTKDIKVRQYLPLLEWTQEDVAEFLTERGVKCHPLYYDEQGQFKADPPSGVHVLSAAIAEEAHRVVQGAPPDVALVHQMRSDLFRHPPELQGWQDIQRQRL